MSEPAEPIEPADKQPDAALPDIADAPDLDAAFESVYEPEPAAVEAEPEASVVEPIVEPVVEAPAPAFSGEVGSGLYRDNSGLARSGQVSEGSVNFGSMAERARESSPEAQDASQETA